MSWFFDHVAWEPNWAWAHGPPDSRPLGKWEDLLAGSAAYLVIITVLSLFMRSRRNAKDKNGDPTPQGYNVTAISMVQNFLMAIYSFYAFWGTALVLWKNWKAAGFDPLVPFCDPHGVMDVNLDYWLYTFYISKYAEFTDTILLLLRAKPVFPPANSQYFLHVFHHAVTASIVWVTWRVPFSVGWIGPLSNGFVHTFMYSYYFLTELGMNRKYGGMLITPIQLVQFVLAILSTVYEGTHMKECNTTPWAMYWLWFTYFVFLSFFVKLYVDKAADRASSRPLKNGGDKNSKDKKEA